MASKPPPLNQTYYVHHSGEVIGPYDLAFIEAMVLASIYPSDVSVSKDGKVSWQRLDVLTAPPVKKTSPPPTVPRSAPPATPRQAQPTRGGQNKNYGCLITVAILIGICVLSSIFNPQTPTRPTYQIPANPQPEQSTYQPPAAAQPVYQPAPQVQNYTMTGQDGQVYTVTDSEYRILLPRKNQLDAWSGRLERLRTYTEAVGRQVEIDRPLVDTSSQGSVDNFNLEVQKYNDSNDQLKTGIDSYNAAVESFNSDLARVGTPR